MGTDEKEMNLKSEPFPWLHCPLLESWLLKASEKLACRACLVVEMVMAAVSLLPECGIWLPTKPCSYYHAQPKVCAEKFVLLHCAWATNGFPCISLRKSAAWLRGP